MLCRLCLIEVEKNRSLRQRDKETCHAKATCFQWKSAKRLVTPSRVAGGKRVPLWVPEALPGFFWKSAKKQKLYINVSCILVNMSSVCIYIYTQQIYGLNASKWTLQTPKSSSGRWWRWMTLMMKRCARPSVSASPVVFFWTFHGAKGWDDPGNCKKLLVVYEGMFPQFFIPWIWRVFFCSWNHFGVWHFLQMKAEVTLQWKTFLFSLLCLCRCTMYGPTSKCDRVTMLKPAFAQEKGPKSASTADRVKLGVVKEWDYLEKCHLYKSSLAQQHDGACQLPSRKRGSEDCSPKSAG